MKRGRLLTCSSSCRRCLDEAGRMAGDGKKDESQSKRGSSLSICIHSSSAPSPYTSLHNCQTTLPFSRSLSMSDFHRLRAELDRSNRLLALAEDLILGYRTGLIRVETQAEGAWTREGDGAGLREMLDTLDREEKEKETTEGQAEDEIGRGEDDWGMTTWISVSSSYTVSVSDLSSGTDHLSGFPSL
jgi:hypothetical protein